MSVLQSYPQWLDKGAWEGFEEMRIAVKKPLTKRAATMVLAELQRIKTAGHCPNAALDQSTNHCWADVYVPQEKEIKAAKTSDADRTARYLAEERARDAELEVQRRGRQPIRRVA